MQLGRVVQHAQFPGAGPSSCHKWANGGAKSVRITGCRETRPIRTNRFDELSIFIVHFSLIALAEDTRQELKLSAMYASMSRHLPPAGVGEVMQVRVLTGHESGNLEISRRQGRVGSDRVVKSATLYHMRGV